VPGEAVDGFSHHGDFAMFEMPPDDAEVFRKLLKRDDIPPEYLRPYQSLLYMEHQEGATGPLGGSKIAMLLIACGFKPELPDERPLSINWDKVKRGTKLEAKQDDAWLPGEFVFFGQHKVACIRLDKNGEVHEFPRFNVRLPSTGEVLHAPVKQPEAEYVPAWKSETETDWTQVAVGEEVWVEVNGEPAEGTFVRLANDGSLVVLIAGTEQSVSQSSVTQAAAV
jgi:hypothetical protein